LSLFEVEQRTRQQEYTFLPWYDELE